MSIENKLYWTLLESEIDPQNVDLYFPPDTPLANVNVFNAHKLYKQLQYRHQRQRNRLLRQQVTELADYQKRFREEYQRDIDLIQPQISACETIKGSDHLDVSLKDIAELQVNIPNLIEATAVAAAIKKQEKKKDDEDEKERKRRRSIKILKDKYDIGFQMIEKMHKEQLDDLNKLQKLDLSVIPPDVIDSLKERERTRSGRMNDSLSPSYSSRNRYVSPSSSTSSSLSPTRRTNTEDHVDIRKTERRRGPDVYNKRVTDASPPPPPPPPSPAQNQYTMQFPNISFSNTTSNVNLIPASNSNYMATTTTTPRKSIPKSTIINISNKVPPTVISSAASRGPPQVAVVPISTPSNRGGLPPPINIEPSSHVGKEAALNGTRIVPSFINRSQPIKETTPLFQQQQKQHTSLLDHGNMMIRNKPTRVVIRGTNGTETVYGNPKDYDDAINSSQVRQDNPIRKRRMPGGQDYLFYKTETGAFVTIGPVSKIQPLIHKFFLQL